MKNAAITVTAAARNFARCLNRVHERNRSLTLVKNGKPFARLIPVGGKTCTGRELAEALARVELSPVEAAAWHRDLKVNRKTLKPARTSWR